MAPKCTAFNAGTIGYIILIYLFYIPLVIYLLWVSLTRSLTLTTTSLPWCWLSNPLLSSFLAFTWPPTTSFKCHQVWLWLSDTAGATRRRSNRIRIWNIRTWNSGRRIIDETTKIIRKRRSVGIGSVIGTRLIGVQCATRGRGTRNSLDTSASH